jgi:hypothetical protein
MKIERVVSPKKEVAKIFLFLPPLKLISGGNPGLEKKLQFYITFRQCQIFHLSPNNTGQNVLILDTQELQLPTSRTGLSSPLDTQELHVWMSKLIVSK